MDKLGVRIGQGKKEKVLIIYNKAVQCKVGKAFSRKSICNGTLQEVHIR